MPTAYPFNAKATKLGYGAIDIVVNVFTPEAFAAGRIPTDEDFRSKVEAERRRRRGVTIEQYLEKMDRAGIERSFLVAARWGDLRIKGSTEIPYEMGAGDLPQDIRTVSPGSPASIRRAACGLKELDGR